MNKSVLEVLVGAFFILDGSRLASPPGSSFYAKLG